jgi:surfeit locus 1 family protein
MDPRYRRVILPGLASLMGVAILLGLGFWQIERKGSKERLVARVEARLNAPPVDLLPEAAWATLHPKTSEYLKVKATGRFLHDKEARLNSFIAGPTPGSTVVGSLILTPLQLADGSIVIVNRGFVPTELTDPARRSQGQVPGEVTVTGLLRAPEKQGLFVPDNDPARNIWFSRQPAEIARAYGLNRVAPFLIDADATPVPGGWPRGGNTIVAFRNDHLQYALTWFALAIALIAVFVAFARGRMRE